MAKHPIPDAALAHHIAVLGKAGSGKTYTAKGLVEAVLLKKGRVCIIDPTGAWHGLRSSANGKRAGYPVVIFGGEHADYPLAQEHGEALAEIIGTSTTPSILDTSLMRVGERTRLFTDFAEALLRKNKGPLHLIVDEAHLFAPQGKVNDPQSGKMVNAANNLVSLGRLRGLRVTLITQRPAKLHKDSLTQVETLVALRLIAPQDRKAVEEWIKDNADQAKAQEIMSSLAKLPTGTGWIWAPELDVLKRATFPKIKTLDTSRAPSHVRKGKGPVLAPINRKAIEQKLREAEVEIIEADPKNLKAEVARLKKELAAKRPAAPVIDRAAIKEAEAAAYARGKLDGYEEAVKGASAETKALLRAMTEAGKMVAKIETWAGKKPPKTVTKPKVPRLGSIQIERVPGRPQAALPGALNGASAAAAKAPAARKTSPNRPAAKADGLSGPQQRIMGALAFWSSIGHDAPTRPQVAAVAGYKPSSGGFNNLISSLVTAEQVTLPATGRVSLAVNYPALTASEAYTKLRSVLTNPQWKIVEAAKGHMADLSRENLALESGYAPTSGGYNNLISSLVTMNILQRFGVGRVALTDWARTVLA